MLLIELFLLLIGTNRTQNRDSFRRLPMGGGPDSEGFHFGDTDHGRRPVPYFSRTVYNATLSGKILTLASRMDNEGLLVRGMEEDSSYGRCNRVLLRVISWWLCMRRPGEKGSEVVYYSLALTAC